MLYDINPADFAHHVRHATSWNDLGIRCGLEKNRLGQCSNRGKMLIIQQKVKNMRLNVDHFYGQSLIPDDVFKTIVRDSDCLSQVQTKTNIDWRRILERIENLCIDTTHFKMRKKQTKYKHYNKVDAIDDETFKTLLKNNTTWRDLSIACGFHGGNGRKFLTERIEKLGLNTNHFDNDMIPSDEIFVVDSQYKDKMAIKKRLIRDFDRAYVCASCKNEHFTKCDGVLMWNKKKIVLQLEHKNGINNDNRLENLEFLCANCHSQTPTFCVGTKKKYMEAWLEEGNTEHKPGSIASLLN